MVERMNRGKTFTEVKWIPVKHLSVVWVNAQRPLNERHAQNIADNFDPEMIGTLSVTKPNAQGIHHIIDGHHRKVAIEMRWGKDELAPCQVFDAADPARAAELFDHINSARKIPQPVDLFRVRVTAGEEVQTEVNRVVKAAGYSVGHRGPGHVHCVAALEAVYMSYGPLVLEGTLRLIKRIWGEDQSAATANTIRGIGMFLSEFRGLDFDKLTDALAEKYTPARFIGAARASKEINGGNMPLAVRDLIIRAYNEKVRNKKAQLVSDKKGLPLKRKPQKNPRLIKPKLSAVA